MRYKGFLRRGAGSGDPVRRLRDDLERQGVAPEFSGPVADRLEAIAHGLSPTEYDAVLHGVAAAYGVHRDDRRRDALPDGDEIERLMRDFAAELQKLDEGLRMLSAYVLRMRSQTVEEDPRIVH